MAGKGNKAVRGGTTGTKVNGSGVPSRAPVAGGAEKNLRPAKVVGKR